MHHHHYHHHQRHPAVFGRWPAYASFCSLSGTDDDDAKEQRNLEVPSRVTNQGNEKAGGPVFELLVITTTNSRTGPCAGDSRTVQFKSKYWRNDITIPGLSCSVIETISKSIARDEKAHDNEPRSLGLPGLTKLLPAISVTTVPQFVSFLYPKSNRTITLERYPVMPPSASPWTGFAMLVSSSG